MRGVLRCEFRLVAEVGRDVLRRCGLLMVGAERLRRRGAEDDRWRWASPLL
jgi:hypothetical protein